MNPEGLFELLDADADGSLSREDLAAAARKLGWHWPEAPLYAVLDFLALRGPLSRKEFLSSLDQMALDPHGPYGEVLRRGGKPCEGETGVSDGALLLIDPQVSFTRGAWMQSAGPKAEAEVAPIRQAFRSCAERLRSLPSGVDLLFTRCPFPPDSYGWDDALVDILGPSQGYIIKPGNSVMWPPTNGFREWVGGLLDRGKTRLVMGGCTLNSCIRISSVDVVRHFRGDGLRVLVDLSLCGARRGNHERSARFGGVSSVESAVREMTAAGVEVVEGVCRG